MQNSMEMSCKSSTFQYNCKFTLCDEGGCISQEEFKDCQTDCSGNCIQPITKHFNYEVKSLVNGTTQIIQSQKYICPDALTYYGVFALIPTIVIILIIVMIVTCCVLSKNRKKADQELNQQVTKLKSEMSVASLLGNPDVCNQLQQVFNKGLSRNASMADYTQNNILEQEGTVLHKASSSQMIPMQGNRSRVYDNSIHDSFKDNC